MKKHLFSRMGCGVMLGFLASLSAVQAADPNDRIQAYLGEGGVTYTRDASSPEAVRSDAWASQEPQGPQGPIRSDMTTDSESAARHQEMEKQFYPLNAQGG